MKATGLLKKIMNVLLQHKGTKEFASEILTNIEEYKACMDKLALDTNFNTYDERQALICSEYPNVNRDNLPVLWTMLTMYILLYPESLKELKENE